MVRIALRTGTNRIILCTVVDFEYTGIIQRRLIYGLVAGQALRRNGIAGQARVITTAALGIFDEEFIFALYALTPINSIAFYAIIYHTTRGNALLINCVESCITGGASVLIGAFSALLVQSGTCGADNSIAVLIFIAFSTSAISCQRVIHCTLRTGAGRLAVVSAIRNVGNAFVGIRCQMSRGAPDAFSCSSAVTVAIFHIWLACVA